MAFQPGQSGNPGGRAREKPWRDALERAVKRREPLDPKDNPQRIDLLAEAAVNAGIAGEVSALREIGDRLDGKPVQALAGADGESALFPQTIQMVPTKPVAVVKPDAGQ